MPEPRTIEERILSQAVEKRLSTELDQIKKIEVDVQTDIGKIVQGQLDGISLTGEGLVIQENLRVQEINLQTESIDIDPFSVIFGQLKLNQPVNAIARITIREADINRALSTDLVRNLLECVELQVNNQIVSLIPEQIEIFLPEDGKIGIRGKMLIKEIANTHVLGYTAILQTQTELKTLLLESFQCTEGKGIAIELILACIQKIKDLINLPDFEWGEMRFCIQDIKVENKMLILLVKADVRQIALNRIDTSRK